MTTTSEEKDKRFFVTRESQETISSRELNYAGLRDLTDIDKIHELEIVGPDGAIRGIKNRVRAGLATYENQVALVKKNIEKGKIVVYTTSFRGVRHTYEECRYVLTVFHNLRVKVFERDIYVHKFYYHELAERLGMEDALQLPVPQVFISGQHVGGKSDLEMLNETGELRGLIANIPRQESSVNCTTCGGYEFIPCRKCGGSKNSVAINFTADFQALRCTHCSENGMEPCPVCEEQKSLTLEQKQEIEAKKRENEHQEKLQKERQEQEKRDRIKREALEAEKQLQLERERLRKEKEEKKRKARLEKEHKRKASEAKLRVAAEIAREMERQREWQAEREKEEQVISEPDEEPESFNVGSRGASEAVWIEEDTNCEKLAIIEKHKLISAKENTSNSKEKNTVPDKEGESMIAEPPLMKTLSSEETEQKVTKDDKTADAVERKNESTTWF